MRDRLFVFALMLFNATLLSCCGSSYVRLEAHPNSWVCPGTPVTLLWAASRSPTLSATPAVNGLGGLDTAGELRVLPAGDTKFFIKAGHWSGLRETQADVKMYEPAVATFPTDDSPPKLQIGAFGPELHCEGKKAFVAFDQSAANWDSRLMVGQVRSLGGNVTVHHDGIVVDVTDQPSPAFQGKSIHGIWVLEASCDPRPPGLAIALTASCPALTAAGGPQP